VRKSASEYGLSLLTRGLLNATGEVIEATEVSHPLIAVEADGTFVKGRERGQVLEVKLAIAYTAKVLRGKRRWLLENKKAWGGVLPIQEFSKRVGFKLEQQYSLSTAGRLVGRSDGGEWITTLFQSFPARVTHQLDLYHLIRNLQENIKDSTAIGECLARAYAGDGAGLVRRLRCYAASEVEDGKELAGALQSVRYVHNNQDRIDSLVAFRRASRSEAERKMYCRGSGAMERNISSSICDRMKHRRMHWSISGAHHMTMVRTELANNPQIQLFN
jgi:hypothetical protein